MTEIEAYFLGWKAGAMGRMANTRAWNSSQIGYAYRRGFDHGAMDRDHAVKGGGFIRGQSCPQCDAAMVMLQSKLPHCWECLACVTYWRVEDGGVHRWTP